MRSGIALVVIRVEMYWRSSCWTEKEVRSILPWSESVVERSEVESRPREGEARSARRSSDLLPSGRDASRTVRPSRRLTGGGLVCSDAVWGPCAIDVRERLSVSEEMEGSGDAAEDDDAAAHLEVDDPAARPIGAV